MPENYRLLIVILSLLLIAPLTAQKVNIIPYYGYLLPRMTDVNDKIESDINGRNGFQRLIGQNLPFPGEFNGEGVIGAQIEYHLNENYFASINVSYYQESVGSEFATGSTGKADRFLYEREVELYDVSINLHYYFNYSTWKRLNTYLGFGVGLYVVNAFSDTESTFSNDVINPIDTHGEFSGNALGASFALGGDLRLLKFLSLRAEGGIQFANIGQLDGSITTISNPAKQETPSQSSFDFTGLFVRGGLSITVPLFL